MSGWHERGWIGQPTLERLSLRYGRPRYSAGQLLRYLAIVGGVFLVLGVLALVAATIASPAFGALVLAGVGGLSMTVGLRLAHDPLRRYPYSGQVLVTCGVALLTGAVSLGASALHLRVTAHFGELLLLPGGLAIVLAYRHGNALLLTLGMLLVFHAVGTWSRYVGHGEYVFAIDAPVGMAAFAALVVAFGCWHAAGVERRWSRAVGFHRVYVNLGLLYLDASLLILSILSDGGTSATWAMALGGVSVAQVVLGARLRDGSFTGFGATFFLIDVFTRYHETFWHQLPLSLFLMIPGALLATAGFLVERRLRRDARLA